MIDLPTGLSLFHFMRPWFLAFVPLVALIWLWIRRDALADTRPTENLAPHLAAALTVGGRKKTRFLPIDDVMLCMAMAALAAAGPTWSRIPNPLVAQTAPLAIVLKVTKSMERRDVAPSRLERSRHKILDLLAGRSGGRTALIAYSGTAHRVAPLTEDPQVIKPFLEGLSVKVMPQAGDNATKACRI